jgi:hypothetical protein
MISSLHLDKSTNGSRYSQLPRAQALPAFIALVYNEEFRSQFRSDKK